MASLQPLPSKKSSPGGGGLLGTGTHLFGSNPIIDNPLNPVYDVEQAVKAGKYTVQQTKNTANELNSAGNTIGGIFSDASNVAAFLTSGKNWLRLGEVIAGLVLVAMGLHQLTGAGGTVVNVAKKAATAGRG